MTKTNQETVLHWINYEIPQCLVRYKSFEEFDKRMHNSIAYSTEWKQYAYAMAKVKWNINDDIKSIPEFKFKRDYMDSIHIKEIKSISKVNN